METARRIRALDSDVLLIFITNMAQLCHQGVCGGGAGLCAEARAVFCLFAAAAEAVNQLARRVRHYLPFRRTAHAPAGCGRHLLH
mgnify:CR=1 FL=1